MMFGRSSVAALLIAASLSTSGLALQLQQKKDASDQQWWLFDKLGLSHKAEVAAPTRPPQAAPKPPAVPSVTAMRNEVMNTEAFGRKTAALCADAAEGPEREKCRQLAGERLFCALLHRHEDEYSGMEGEEEAQKKCSSIDIMENSVEATRDVETEEESEKAC